MPINEETWEGLKVVVVTPDTGVAWAPVIFGIHGRASSPERILPWAQTLGEQFIHVLPRGRLSSGNGSAWYEKNAEREQELETSRTALIELVNQARKRFKTGPERMAVWGFSQGGLMSLELGLRTLSPLAATVSVAGKLDDVSGAQPEVIGRARGRNFFLLHGTEDTTIPSEASRNAYRLLARHGGHVELAELVMAHELTPVALAAVRGYLNSVFGESPAMA
jgi:predicted esterase